MLITNQMKRSPAQLVDRYARHMIIENVISDAIDSFRMDALSYAVPMRINADVHLTVMASVLYRLKGTRIGQGNENAQSARSYATWCGTGGKVTITEDEILAQLRARSSAHYLMSAGYPTLHERIPWLGNKTLRVQLSRRP